MYGCVFLSCLLVCVVCLGCGVFILTLIMVSLIYSLYLMCFPFAYVGFLGLGDGNVWLVVYFD